MNTTIVVSLPEDRKLLEALEDHSVTTLLVSGLTVVELGCDPALVEVLLAKISPQGGRLGIGSDLPEAFLALTCVWAQH